MVSWGQVGKRTKQVISDVDIELLKPERDCQPRSEPCAAYGLTRAMVLGPHSEGFMLKYEETGASVGVDVSAQYKSQDGSLVFEPPLVRQLDKSTWLISAPSTDVVGLELSIVAQIGPAHIQADYRL